MPIVGFEPRIRMEGKASLKISPYAQRQEEDWRRAEPKGGAQWESSAREPRVGPHRGVECFGRGASGLGS